jgi:hypothetical protein
MQKFFSTSSLRVLSKFCSIFLMLLMLLQSVEISAGPRVSPPGKYLAPSTQIDTPFLKITLLKWLLDLKNRKKNWSLEEEKNLQNIKEELGVEDFVERRYDLGEPVTSLTQQQAGAQKFAELWVRLKQDRTLLALVVLVLFVVLPVFLATRSSTICTSQPLNYFTSRDVAPPTIPSGEGGVIIQHVWDTYRIAIREDGGAFELSELLSIQHLLGQLPKWIIQEIDVIRTTLIGANSEVAATTTGRHIAFMIPESPTDRELKPLRKGHLLPPQSSATIRQKTLVTPSFFQSTLLHEIAHTLHLNGGLTNQESGEWNMLHQQSGTDADHYASPYAMRKESDDLAETAEFWGEDSVALLERAIAEAQAGKPLLLKKVLFVARIFAGPLIQVNGVSTREQRSALIMFNTELRDIKGKSRQSNYLLGNYVNVRRGAEGQISTIGSFRRSVFTGLDGKHPTVEDNIPLAQQPSASLIDPQLLIKWVKQSKNPTTHMLPLFTGLPKDHPWENMTSYITQAEIIEGLLDQGAVELAQQLAEGFMSAPRTKYGMWDDDPEVNLAVGSALLHVAVMTGEMRYRTEVLGIPEYLESFFRRDGASGYFLSVGGNNGQVSTVKNQRAVAFLDQMGGDANRVRADQIVTWLTTKMFSGTHYYEGYDSEGKLITDPTYAIEAQYMGVLLWVRGQRDLDKISRGLEWLALQRRHIDEDGIVLTGVPGLLYTRGLNAGIWLSVRHTAGLSMALRALGLNSEANRYVPSLAYLQKAHDGKLPVVVGKISKKSFSHENKKYPSMIGVGLALTLSQEQMPNDFKPKYKPLTHRELPPNKSFDVAA